MWESLYCNHIFIFDVVMPLPSSSPSRRRAQIRRSPSLSCSRGRFAGFATPIPRAARASTAAFAAPSDDFFDRPRVLRRAPNACALMTASVPQMGGGPGDGERDVRETVLVRVREREE